VRRDQQTRDHYIRVFVARACVRSGWWMRASLQQWNPLCGFPGEGPVTKRVPRPEEVAFTTANVTNWTSFRYKFESPTFPSPEVILLQEALLTEGRRQGHSCQLKGFSSILVAAKRTDRGGSSGGVAILCKQHIANHPTSRGCHWGTGVGLQFGKVCIDVGAFHGQTGGVKATERRLSKFVRELWRPDHGLLIGGDFNVAPAQVQTWIQNWGLPLEVFRAGASCYTATASRHERRPGCLGDRTGGPTRIALDLWGIRQAILARGQGHAGSSYTLLDGGGHAPAHCVGSHAPVPMLAGGSSHSPRCGPVGPRGGAPQAAGYGSGRWTQPFSGLARRRCQAWGGSRSTWLGACGDQMSATGLSWGGATGGAMESRCPRATRHRPRQAFLVSRMATGRA
jgi:hypothetical protein